MLEGIDAPEVGQDHSGKAKQALSDLVFGNAVTIKVTGEDRYKRTLAYVFVGDVDVNAKLIEDGWAWHFEKYNCEERLAEQQQAARDAKRGLWSHDHPTAPWEYRKLKRERAEFQEAAEEFEWQKGVKQDLAHPKLMPKPKSTKPKNAPPRMTKAAEPAAADYWLNISSNVRHNATCEHFGKTKRGRACGASEGKACGICGG